MRAGSVRPLSRKAGLRAAVAAVALALVATLGSAGTAQAAATCDGLAVTINGTNGNDTLTGTAGRDVIAGGNGDDVVDGAGGDDVICGGNGKDRLTGGTGADRLLGDNDDDVLVAGDGDDVLLGGNGDDELRGGTGQDQLTGENGNDRLFGEDGDDVLDAANGDDLLDAGSGQDRATGGHGKDRCVDAETTTSCEDVSTSPVVDPLAAQGPAPAGEVSVDGPGGVRLDIDSTGGISPWDVRIAADDLLTHQVDDVLASPVYQFEIPQGGAFTSADLTIPYEPERLGSFPAADLRIYHMDDNIGLWVPADGDQVVDPVAHTVSTTVTHFSAYAVFMLDEQGFARYWPTKETFCLQAGDADQVGVDVAFVIDTSGSMSSNDPRNLRVDGAEAFLDQMRPIDSAAVVDFESSATTQIGLTSLSTTTGVAAVRAALERSRYAGGGTDISAGVDRGLRELEASAGVGRAKVMVLLTDGDSSYSDYLTTAARDQGVVIHAIGLGSGVKATLLRSIAQGTGGQYLQLSSASQLPALYAGLGKGLIDDGTDTDGDGLTDCEEQYGVLTSYGFYDVALDPTQNEPFLADRRVTSDPVVQDTDGDGLTDGQELRGKPMGQPLDLRDYAATRQTYKFLIDAGITKYYIGRSLPRVVDSDKDTVSDADETNGLPAGTGVVHTSRADRRDTDFDGADDALEYRRGTDPRQPDANELGIPDLPPYTLFEPSRYAGLAPVPAARYVIAGGVVTAVLYDQDVVTFDSSWNCVTNCSALVSAASSVESSWCWLPWGSNCTVDDQVRTLVQRAVEGQRIFTKSGDFTGTFVAEQAAGECVATTAVANCKVSVRLPSSIPLDDPQLSDGPAHDNVDATIAEVLLNLPGGYRPKGLCEGGAGGVYQLVDALGQVVYVGQTNDFARREAEHLRDDRFKDLTFQRKYSAANYQVRRGLEQSLFNDTWGDVDIRTAQSKGSLNGQRPMAAKNPSLDKRLDLARQFKSRC